ncbi:MAG: hypothetical protein AMJ60_05580, partial [Desulfobacterales bacterium SG8_35]
MRRRTHKIAPVFYLASILIWMFVFANTVQAVSFFDQFMDPHDSKFDVSQWVLDKKGVLPVPIIITEPAVGYGAGAALLFFHAKEDEQFLERA